MHQRVRESLPRDARIAVVGLGAAGIATVMELRAAGFSDITVFEATSKAGGTWVYSPNVKNAHSSMYKSLHCNIPKDSMCYVGRPFKPEVRSFASHTDVANYLQKIVAEEDILSIVRYNSRVARVVPLEPGTLFTRWAVQTFVTPGAVPPVADENQEARINSSGTTAARYRDVQHSNDFEPPCVLSDVEIFDAVILCNGHYTVQNDWRPDGAAFFPGEISHSHTYRTPERFAGKKVVVLGAGPSGTDIAIELARNGADVTLSHRSGGGKGKYGGLVPQAAAVVKCKSNGSLVLSDGSEVENVDELLLCTGYAYSFPFLTDSSGVRISPDKRAIHGLFMHCLCMEHVTLGMIGMPFKVIPFPLFQDQASFVAGVLRGAVPFEVSREMLYFMHEQEMSRRDPDQPEKYLHQLDDDQWEYRQTLSKWTGRKGPETSVREMYQDSRDARTQFPLDYRARVYRKLGSGEGQWSVTFRGYEAMGDTNPAWKDRWMRCEEIPSHTTLR